MATRVRIALKTFAVVRFLVSNQRLTKISTNAKSVIHGSKTASEVLKEVNPFSRQSFYMQLKSPKTKKKLTWYSFTLASLGVIGYEYHKNCSDVPITNRKHFAIIPRHYELKYQKVFIDTLQQQYSIEKDGNQQSLILPETDERVLLVKKIVSELQEACVYFSPECEEYMSHMKVIVIDDDEVNAYSTLGSVLVINTGVLEHFQHLYENGTIHNIEECIACVIAHELAHSLSRHSLETMLYWASFAYYLYITFIPDLFIMPLLKGYYDRHQSRQREYEADYQALYLLKRAGYDPSSMISTLACLPTTVEDYEILSKTKEIISHHPRNESRIARLQDNIFAFEKDFQNRFEIYQTSQESKSSFDFASTLAKRLFSFV